MITLNTEKDHLETSTSSGLCSTAFQNYFTSSRANLEGGQTGVPGVNHQSEKLGMQTTRSKPPSNYV